MELSPRACHHVVIMKYYGGCARARARAHATEIAPLQYDGHDGKKNGVKRKKEQRRAGEGGGPGSRAGHMRPHGRRIPLSSVYVQNRRSADYHRPTIYYARSPAANFSPAIEPIMMTRSASDASEKSERFAAHHKAPFRARIRATTDRKANRLFLLFLFPFFTCNVEEFKLERTGDE